MKPKFALFLLSVLVLECSSLPQPLEDTDTDFGGRIVGGTPIDITKANYQVALLKYYSFFCGGSLITEKHVLTAAHCTDGSDPSDLLVRAGSKYANEGGTVKGVYRLHQHSNYNSANQDFDIAVLTLDSSYTVNGFNISAIPFTRLPPETGSTVYVSGYGATSYKGPSSTQLMQVAVYVEPFSTCNAAYGFRLTSNMLCARASGKDSCQGDSGGPLVYNNQLVGIVSFGNGCASQRYPGVYTSMASLFYWVRDILCNENMCD